MRVKINENKNGEIKFFDVFERAEEVPKKKKNIKNSVK